MLNLICRISIQKRLILTGTIILLLLFIMVGTAFQGFGHSNDGMHRATELRASATQLYILSSSIKEVVLTQNADFPVEEAQLAAISKSLNKMGELHQHLVEGHPNPVYLDEIAKHWEMTSVKVKGFLQQGGEIDGSLESLAAAGKLVEDTSRIADHMQVLAESEVAASQQEQNRTMYTVGAILAFIIIAIIASLMTLGYSVVVPVRIIRQEIQEIETKKDLSKRLDVIGQDGIAKIAESTNTMLQRFQTVIKDVQDSIGLINTSADSLSVATTQAYEGMKEQMNQTDQVTTAINEMAQAVQEVASSASSAASSTQEADEEVKKGRQVVMTTIEAINQLASEVEQAADVIQNLHNETDEIGSVLDVIRGIADQTNLLALNAAIEAARAGEQGRGFAVVADEVRTLAQRTQESTEEIQQKIEKLQQWAGQAVTVMEHGTSTAENSVEQASSAGQSLETINNSVSTITDMNTRIASAAEEQTAMAGEVERHAATIREVAQESGQSMSQIDNSSDELARLALDLRRLADQFKA